MIYQHSETTSLNPFYASMLIITGLSAMEKLFISETYLKTRH